MKLETFFEKFEQFADAPNAVEKLRELVLELAIRGKLVPQEAEREPSLFRSRLKNEGAPESRQSDAGLAGLEIPSNWARSTLARVADCRAAAKVSSREIHADDWVLDLEDIDGHRGHVTRFATFAERRSLSTKAAFAAGDVLYGKLRPYLNKVVVASRAGYCTTEIVPLRPSSSLSPEFLRVFLRPPTFLDYSRSKGYGMKMPRLGTKDLEAALVPVPPPQEQALIVAKVDELTALCNRLEEQHQVREACRANVARASLARFADEPTRANLGFLFHDSHAIEPADLRKAILTLAVQGRLVPQDAADEPGGQLLRKLENQRREFAEAHKFRGTTEEISDSEQAPFAIPTSWKWVPLSSLCNAVTDGDHLPPPRAAEGIAFLTIGNITTGVIDFAGARLVPDGYYRALAQFRRPAFGDILYTVVGATYGRPALVATDRPFCVQRHIAILKPAGGMDVGFMIAVLRSPLVYEQARASTTGTAQPTIPLGSLRNFLIPLPPADEQRRIAARVDQLMGLVDELEGRLASAQRAGEKLMEAIVAEIDPR